MKFFERIDNSLVFRANGETVMITPWGRDSFRVRGVFLGDISDESVAILDVETDDNHITIHIEDEYAVITNGKITAECRVNLWGQALETTFKNQNGKMLLKEISNGGALQLKARHFKPLQGGNCKLKASFNASPDEKIYGMGQYQQEVLNLKGCNLELAHRNSQASVPFYISSEGYGFLWHNAAIGEVHFGSNTTEWIAESTKQLDYWITAGDTPAEIEEAYATVTGTAPMMPEYGLGFWQCKLRYYNEEEVLNVAREYKRRNIPIDVIVIDYYHWPRCGDWRFDEEFFPNPKKMVQELKDMGIETMVSVWPQVDVRSENYEEMKQQGLLVKSNIGMDVQMIFHGNNLFMDATNPRTREYVWNKCKQNYADMGINAFWLDEAEPEFGTYDFEHYRYHAGSVAETGNIYPREYARLFYEGQKANGQEDIVNLIRCAWVGSQKYGALVWSGDIHSTFKDFRNQICAGIHMGIAGIPWWTTDIGGFHGGNINDDGFKELIVRWFEYGTFCPVMRIHGCRLPGKDVVDRSGEAREWTGADNEVWSYGEENYEIMVKYINVREALRDYTREVMKETHEKGSPVIRGIFYEFPEDDECYDIKDAYMYGGDILVAPVCHEGEKAREVYLPKGAEWTEISTGKEYEGGRKILADAPIDVIPLYVKNGREDLVKALEILKKW